MPPPSIPVEEAWQLIVDGLHIHRYFLHVHPRRLSDLAETQSRLAEIPALPASLPDLADRWPIGALEHAFQAQQPAIETIRFVRALSARPNRSGLIVVEDDDLLGGLEGHVVRASSLLSGWLGRKHPIVRMLMKAGLYDLTRLQLTVIVRSPTERGTARLTSPAACFIDPRLLLHEQCRAILAEVARRWVITFYQDATQRGTPFRADLLHAAEEILSLGLWDRLARSLGAHHEYKAADLRPLMAELERRTRDLAPTIPVVAEALDDLILYDLLTTNFPWPGRWRKFAAGSGPGQSDG